MVEKWSFGYWLIRPYFYFAYWIFHRKIVIIGKKNIPKNKPVIYAPNHPNALHDDLSIVYSAPHQVVWLGRADIFKSAIARPFLKFIKLIPVYRIRDGKESLTENDKTFTTAIRVLQHNHAIGLYPEGDNSFNRQMKPHKKAVPRIAFLGGEQTGFTLDTKIIPVGLYFDQNHNFGRRCLIIFGKPLNVTDYYGIYRENPYKATMALKNDLHQAILPLTLNYNSVNNIEGFEAVREISSKWLFDKQASQDNLYNRFLADQQLIRNLDQMEIDDPEKASNLAKKALEFVIRLKLMGLRSWLVDIKEENTGKKILEFIGLLVSFPLFVYGFLLNAFPFFFVDTLVKKKVKNEFFRGTFSFGISFIFFPLAYILEMLILSPLLPGWYIKLLFLISIPLSGKFAFWWYIRLRKTIGRWRWLRIKRTKPDIYNEIHGIKQEIVITVGLNQR